MTRTQMGPVRGQGPETSPDRESRLFTQCYATSSLPLQLEVSVPLSAPPDRAMMPGFSSGLGRSGLRTSRNPLPKGPRAGGLQVRLPLPAERRRCGKLSPSLHWKGLPVFIARQS